MQRNWNEPIETDQSDIYWYQDSPDVSNSGVQRPAEWVLQYCDETAEAWVDVANPSGYDTARHWIWAQPRLRLSQG